MVIDNVVYQRLVNFVPPHQN